MKNQTLLLKAAQQALSDILGYDEATAYCMLLQKQEKELESEFSYSKKYRIMKSLFEAGAVAKFKPKDRDFFSYLLLPPSFLYFSEGEKVDKEIIELLESIYLENHSEMLEKELSQIILKDEKPLLAFLLKYFMKDSARLVTDEMDYKKILGSRSSKITIINRKENARKSGVIDKNLFFEFASIPNGNEIEKREYIGYMSRNASIKHVVVH